MNRSKAKRLRKELAQYQLKVDRAYMRTRREATAIRIVDASIERILDRVDPTLPMPHPADPGGSDGSR